TPEAAPQDEEDLVGAVISLADSQGARRQESLDVPRECGPERFDVAQSERRLDRLAQVAEPGVTFGVLLGGAAGRGNSRDRRGGVGAAAFRHVLELAGTIGPRRSGTDADGRAVEYIASAMEAAGLSVTRQAVPVAPTDEGERSVGSWNLIGDLPGATRDTIVLAAHHDSRSVEVPGANDDASGVGVLLEVARLVASRPHRLTYRFISFCAEEE